MSKGALSFANVLDDSLWNGPQTVIALEVNSSGVPAHDGIAATGVRTDIGVIERTVLIADPIAAVPGPIVGAGLPGLILGFAGVGYMAYRRKIKASMP